MGDRINEFEQYNTIWFTNGNQIKKRRRFQFGPDAFDVAELWFSQMSNPLDSVQVYNKRSDLEWVNGKDCDPPETKGAI